MTLQDPISVGIHRSVGVSVDVHSPGIPVLVRMGMNFHGPASVSIPGSVAVSPLMCLRDYGLIEEVN